MLARADTIGTTAYPAFTLPPLLSIYPAPANVKVINTMLNTKAAFFMMLSLSVSICLSEFSIPII